MRVVQAHETLNSQDTLLVQVIDRLKGLFEGALHGQEHANKAHGFCAHSTS